MTQDKAAATLAARMTLSGRRFTLVIFSDFWNLTGAELESGTIPGAGKQQKWYTEYFRKLKLFTETVNGIQLLNATWRAGPDRKRGPNITNNLSEEKNNEFSSKLALVVKSLAQERGESQQRPTLPQLVERLEHVLMRDEAFVKKHSEPHLYAEPWETDLNMLTGHSSIQNHSWRLAAKVFVPTSEL